MHFLGIVVVAAAGWFAFATSNEVCSSSSTFEYQSRVRFESKKSDGKVYDCVCGPKSNCRKFSCTLKKADLVDDTGYDDDGDEIIIGSPATTVPTEPTNADESNFTECQRQLKKAREDRDDQEANGISYEGPYINCERDGSFSPKRCGMTGCWCVNTETGVAIENSGNQPENSFTCSKCWDEITEKHYEFGSIFMRTQYDDKLCKCDEQSAITCTPFKKSCPVPIRKAATTYPKHRYGCYDSYTETHYRNGERFVRTKNMNADDNITGKYNCYCSYGSTRCTAFDIPCCDVSTGKYVGKNSKMIRQLRGKTYQCTCYGGRGSFRNCTPVSSADNNSSGGSSAGTTTQARCYDSQTGKTYANEQMFWKTLTHRSYGTYRQRCQCTTGGLQCVSFLPQD